MPAVRGLILAIASIAVVASITVVVFVPDLPYLFPGIDNILDSGLRYKVSKNIEVKDWKSDLVVEQSIWTSEISRVELGLKTAKSYKLLRDFKLYLADSYFKDGLHYGQAKAAYLSALLEPKFKEQRSFIVSDSEIYGKLGYCCLRTGDLSAAQTYLRKCVAVLAAEKNPDGKVKELGRYNEAVDNLTACLIAQGQAAEAQELVDQRLKNIEQKDIALCVEKGLLANGAGLAILRGDNTLAEKLYKRAIQLYRADTPGGQLEADRGDRGVAVIMKDYSAFLRKRGRFSEADAQMKDALAVLDLMP